MLSKQLEENVVLHAPEFHAQQVGKMGAELQNVDELISVQARPFAIPPHLPFCHAHLPLILLQRPGSGSMTHPGDTPFPCPGAGPSGAVHVRLFGFQLQKNVLKQSDC